MGEDAEQVLTAQNSCFPCNCPQNIFMYYREETEQVMTQLKNPPERKSNDV